MSRICNTKKLTFSDNSTRSVVVEEGKSVQLECYASGYPQPKIYW